MPPKRFMCSGRRSIVRCSSVNMRRWQRDCWVVTLVVRKNRPAFQALQLGHVQAPQALRVEVSLPLRQFLLADSLLEPRLVAADASARIAAMASALRRGVYQR